MPAHEEASIFSLRDHEDANHHHTWVKPSTIEARVRALSVYRAFDSAGSVLAPLLLWGRRRLSPEILRCASNTRGGLKRS